MTKQTLLTFLLLMLAGTTLEAAAPGRRQPPQPRQPTYQEALYHQVLLQEQRAAEYLTWLQHDDRVADKFQDASRLVEVKKSLYNRLGNSPALRSNDVRSKLYQVMSLESIEKDDLIALQQVVNDELHRSETAAR